ncbi:MAG: Sulfate adenylyltransferase subunit 1, partial [Myxococcaceae bacterium]|nr:Sulfate adenylyltransferase subunit 1 [Myxococcaceae bacterium]
GENVVQRGDNTPWYKGPTVLGFLEQVPIADDQNLTDFRFPVQYVLRPNLNYRGFAGQIASGVIRKGDDVMVLPSGKRSRIKAIDTFDGERDEAFGLESVTLRLEHEIDCSRGDMIVKPDNRPRASRGFDAHVVWLHERPLDPEKSYFLKHTTQTIRMQVTKVQSKTDLVTLERVPAETLELNEIGLLTITTHRPIFHDPYAQNRVTGAFIIVDSLSNATVGAGMILRDSEDDRDQGVDDILREARAGSGLENKTQVSPRERRERLGQTGVTVWLSGLPGSGKVTLAYVLERKLFDLGHAAHVLAPEGDPLSAIAVATRGLTDAGLITICALPSKTRAERNTVRERVGKERFAEVFVDTDPALCRERRPDGDFEGFEAPDAPDLTLPMDQSRVERAVDKIIDLLAKRGQVDLS